MLLTITTTHHPATDLSFLLHKHPARLQTFGLNFGQVHVFYPEATDERCTAALLLDVDAVGLVRGKKGSSGEGRTLAQYVNDRPYVASSLLSVAIADVFGSAMAGRSGERPETAAAAIALEATLPVLPCRGGEDVITRLFGPLGYEVESHRLSLDEQFPEWGESGYFHVRLRATVRLADLLSHLYVLIPVLDDEKHYYVGDDEVDKLLARGAGWLPSHPEKSLITDRYLSHKRTLTRAALERLLGDDADEDEAASGHDAEEAVVEERVNLHTQRHGAVLAALRETGARRVIDLGCGDGKLLKLLLAERAFTEVAGMDVSHRALEFAARRLHLDSLPPAQRARLNLFQGSLTYRDGRLAGYDAATVVEVIEHLDPPRLAVFERCVFEAAHPASVVVTTPNVEYNVRFPALPAGTLRHKDHRFEWTRAEFEAWAATVAGRFGYTVRFLPIGPDDPEVGAPSQMAVFTT
ncbi:MAG: hypothetical protein QOD62_2821 [Actinomycetota bacterium]|nr:hypothetical protein [Actinomycetota bacterium]